MSNRVSGTVRSVTVNGVPYDALGDANITVTLNEYENDSIATSGLPIHKKTKRVARAESVVVGTTWAEKATLIAAADDLDPQKFSIEFACGSIIKGEGQINIESDESEEKRTTLILLPDRGWTIFAA